eukprot:800686-Rhodomonas_salina.2
MPRYRATDVVPTHPIALRISYATEISHPVHGTVLRLSYGVSGTHIGWTRPHAHACVQPGKFWSGTRRNRYSSAKSALRS